jgi:hypothetical protein
MTVLPTVEVPVRTAPLHSIAWRYAVVTSNEIREEALLLAESGAEITDAVSVLVNRVDRRIPLVLAKRQLEERPLDPLAVRALEIVHAALERGTWAE